MDDGVEPFEVGRRHVAQVDVHRREVVRRRDEVALVVQPDVEPDDLVAGGAQRRRHLDTDVAAVTRHQNPHGRPRPRRHMTSLRTWNASAAVAAGLDAAHGHQPGERLGPEPVLVVLGAEVLHDQLDLAFGDGLGGASTNRFGLAEVALVLRDLVLGDEVVAERVPRQLGDRAVVLVLVVAVVAQHDVGVDARVRSSLK